MVPTPIIPAWSRCKGCRKEIGKCDFCFDQAPGTGCFTCIMADEGWNDVVAKPASWRGVITIERRVLKDGEFD